MVFLGFGYKRLRASYLYVWVEMKLTPTPTLSQQVALLPGSGSSSHERPYAENPALA